MMIPGPLLSYIRLSHSHGREKAELATKIVNIILLIHFESQQARRTSGASQKNGRKSVRSARRRHLGFCLRSGYPIPLACCFPFAISCIFPREFFPDGDRSVLTSKSSANDPSARLAATGLIHLHFRATILSWKAPHKYSRIS